MWKMAIKMEVACILDELMWVMWCACSPDAMLMLRWWCDIVVSIVWHMNEVTHCQAWLVFGWLPVMTHKTLCILH